MKVKIEKLNGRASRLEWRAPRADPDAEKWDRIVAGLTEDEQVDLARALVALDKSHGTASLESLPPAQKAAWEKAHRLYGMEASAARR